MNPWACSIVGITNHNELFWFWVKLSSVLFFGLCKICLSLFCRNSSIVGDLLMIWNSFTVNRFILISLHSLAYLFPLPHWFCPFVKLFHLVEEYIAQYAKLKETILHFAPQTFSKISATFLRGLWGCYLRVCVKWKSLVALFVMSLSLPCWQDLHCVYSNLQTAFIIIKQW